MTPVGGLAASALAQALRDSTWLYPAVLAFHLAGVALLFFSIAVVDLRLLGLWRHRPVRRVAARLLPWTAAGFAVIVPSGLLMFVAHAGELVESGVFALKMGLIFAAGVNAAAFHAGIYRGVAQWDVGRAPPLAARLAGFASLGFWTAVIGCAVVLLPD